MRKSKRHNFLNIANPSSFFLCVFTQSEFPVRISYRVEPRDESEAAMWTNTIWPPPEFYSRPSMQPQNVLRLIRFSIAKSSSER